MFFHVMEKNIRIEIQKDIMLWLSIFELKNSKNDIFKIFGSVLHIQKYVIGTRIMVLISMIHLKLK